MANFQKRLLNVIPGGAHTYSRGYDQHPSNSPEILKRGKGAYVFGPDDKKYLDYGMGLRSVSIGYSEERINDAAIRQIENGNNLTKPSMVELEAAELLTSLIDSVDMVKFTKNGSTATTAAIKLARAYTGREKIARCAQHPFFSYDDWFIASTPIKFGIPQDNFDKIHLFDYNDISSLETLFDAHPNQIACVILEPAANEHPNNNFLHDVQTLCKKNGTLLVFDEMISGFRWHLKGAQHYYKVAPDLCTFGKAMANGFSVAAVAGKREVMKLGSIESEGSERLFLLSTTHGAEMCSLGAFIETIRFLEEKKVIDHFWAYGKTIIESINTIATSLGIEQFFFAGGIECSPIITTLNDQGDQSLEFRTLFLQEMIKNGVIIPCLALCYRHGEEELKLTNNAVFESLTIYKKALAEGCSEYLEGPAVKPVFRKIN